MEPAEPCSRTAVKRRLLGIKRMLERHSATEVDIKTIGAIEDVGDYKALCFRMVYVKWISIDKEVPFGGFASAVHGSLTEADPRMQAIFFL